MHGGLGVGWVGGVGLWWCGERSRQLLKHNQLYPENEILPSKFNNNQGDSFT